MGFQRVRHDWVTELTDWLIYVTKLNIHIYSTIVTAQSISCFWFFATQRTVAWQTPLSMGFPRQEYWSVLPFPSPRDISLLGIKPASPALSGRFFTAEPPGKCLHIYEKVEHSLLQSFHSSFLVHLSSKSPPTFLIMNSFLLCAFLFCWLWEFPQGLAIGLFLFSYYILLLVSLIFSFIFFLFFCIYGTLFKSKTYFFPSANEMSCFSNILFWVWLIILISVMHIISKSRLRFSSFLPQITFQ